MRGGTYKDFFGVRGTFIHITLRIEEVLTSGDEGAVKRSFEEDFQIDAKPESPDNGVIVLKLGLVGTSNDIKDIFSSF